MATAAPLKIAVFDLDYTVWLPEMYQLNGPPKQIKKRTFNSRKRASSTTRSTRTAATAAEEAAEEAGGGGEGERGNNGNEDGNEYIVVDQSNTQIRLFPGASYALSQINKLRDVHNVDILAAVASRTDEPNWASMCMDWLSVPHYDDDVNNNTRTEGKTLTACFDHVIIGFDDKKWHFKRIHQITKIPYESMAFFDNEMRNIRSVRELGVKCIYTPDGMTKDAWHEALGLFDMNTGD